MPVTSPTEQKIPFPGGDTPGWHLLPCGALRRPAPTGAGKMRIATGLTPLAMTEVDDGWSQFAGSAVIVPNRTAERS